MRPIEPSQRMTLEEYLAWEERQPLRYEYLAGAVYLAQGGTARHNLITLNIVAALRSRARSRGCRVFASDVKLQAASDRMYYPDVLVACGKAADVDMIVEAPSLVVEVTSRSSRGTDRREKLEAYMRIPSLHLYLVVDQRRRHVMVYKRDDIVGWIREEMFGQEEIDIAFLQGKISMDEIYDDVTLPPLRVGENGEPIDWEDNEY